MKRMECEMCGSHDFAKQEGLFVCQSCGMKYSPEDAKNLMKDIPDETAKSENVETARSSVGGETKAASNVIDGYLQMAANAANAGSNVETENYCNKILELDATNYKAWQMKGAAVGWQSTVALPRVSEALFAYVNALQYCPESERPALVAACCEDISNLYQSILASHIQVFMISPSAEEVTTINAAVVRMQQDCETFLKATGMDLEKLNLAMGIGILNATRNSFNSSIYQAYKGDDGKPVDFQFRQFISQSDFCIKVIKIAATLFGTYDVEVAKALENDGEAAFLVYEYRSLIYKTMIEINTLVRDACSWAPKFSALLGQYYVKNLTLTQAAIDIRNKQNAQWKTEQTEWTKKLAEKKEVYQSEKERLDREERQRKINAYWAEHADEKARIDAELADLNKKVEEIIERIKQQVAEVRKEIDAIPGKEDLDRCDTTIQALSQEKEKLGIFKMKEKKALQEKIDQANAEKATIQAKMDAEKAKLEKKIDEMKKEGKAELAPFQKRIDELQAELKQDR